MNFALFAVILAAVWILVTDSLTMPNLLLGIVIGVAALWFIRERVSSPYLLRRVGRIIRLVLLFFYELALSAIRVAILVVTPDLKRVLHPSIIAFPLRVQSDAEITLLANLITLTPGTLSVDVSEDRKYLYVHAISAPDKQSVIEDIASGFEARIMEVFE